MSAISSINFKKSNAIQTRHNDRDLPPSYLISDIGCEVNRTHKEALKLRNEIIENAINAYNKNKSPKAPNFKAKSYEWSAVVNIKPDTTMQDLERLAKHFETKYGFQCYQIAIHRDEGYIENGEKHINHHAHLEFITLDKQTGKNMYRRELINPKILRQIQTEVAEILGMERGIDKRISKRERVEPRKYAQMKEAERKEQAKLKAEHKQELESKEAELKFKDTKLEQEKLSSKEIKAYIEQFRKNCTGKDLPKEFFRDISNLKKQAEPTTKEFLDDTLNSLLQNYLKEKEKNIELETKNKEIETEILSKQELEIEFQNIIKRHEAEIEKLKQQKSELEAKLKEFNLEQEQKEKSPAQIDLNFINKIENTRFMDNKDDIYSLYSTLGKYGLIDQQKYLETKLREPKISTPQDYIRDVKEKILSTIEQDKNKAIDTELNKLIQENKELREENAELIRQNNFYKSSRSNKNQQQQNKQSQQHGLSR
ncbi:MULTISPECIES: mobilization protein [Campylobacter]|uniref:mobilization protein n=4 Tax=Campylobacteraceae TaxID=72294 RepID=UPI001EF062B3|nr:MULTISPECIES: mobilization protein [unclassified Campylobacter]MCR8690887.1 mobilization protein [Campylobacter sp. RM9264]